MANHLSALVSLIASVTLISGCEETLAPIQVQELALRGLYGAALSDDGHHAVAGSMHHGISLWRLTDWERLYDWNHAPGSTTNMVAADFSPDGRWVLTADEQTLGLWNVASGENLRYWSAPAEILSVQLSAEGQVALLGLANNTAVLFDIRRGGVLRTFNHGDRVNSVALSDDGRVAVTGSEDYTAVAWNPRTGDRLKRIRHEDDVQLVAVSQDGTLALSMSRYDKALLWRTGSEDVVGEIPLAARHLKRGLQFTAARFSNDNQWLLTGQTDQRVALWHLNPLNKVREWELPTRRAWRPVGAVVIDLAFSDDPGVCHAVTSDGYLTVLDCSPTSTEEAGVAP